MSNPSVADIPEEWKQLILKIRENTPTALISGGCLRDILHGKPIKDIDIVVPHNCSLYHVYVLLEGEDYDETSVESAQQDINFSAEAKFTVQWLRYPVNLISCAPNQSPIEKCKEHDFGLCQIWYDGEDLEYTNNYYCDCKNQILTVCRCNNYAEYEAILNHYKRISLKYQYPLVLPCTFAQKIIRWQQGEATL